MISRTLLVVVILAWPGDVAAQAYRCELRSTSEPQQFKGICQTASDSMEAEFQEGGAGAGRWAGAFTRRSTRHPVEIVETPYPNGARKVLRSNVEWLIVREWTLSDSSLSFGFNPGDAAPPTSDDIAILAEAQRLMSRSEWDRGDDRNCENDAPGRVSLYCALAKATSARMGRYYHRQPALRLVRELVAARWPERIQGHRLMDFNNHAETSLKEVLEVLGAALTQAWLEAAAPADA